jgi:hypothetical protein
MICRDSNTMRRWGVNFNKDSRYRCTSTSTRGSHLQRCKYTYSEEWQPRSPTILSLAELSNFSRKRKIKNASSMIDPFIRQLSSRVVGLLCLR